MSTRTATTGRRTRRFLAATLAATTLLASPLAANAAGEDEDYIPPTITFTGADRWYADTYTLKVGISDNSGLKSSGYTLTGAQEGGGPVPSTGIVISASGQTWVGVEAEDRAGNYANASAWVGIDRTAPEVHVSPSLTQPITLEQYSPLSVDYSCTDAHSGVKSCEGPVPSGSLLDTSVPGSHEVSFTATDNVGRTTTKKLTYDVTPASVKVDKAPKLSGTTFQTDSTITVTPPETTPAATSYGYQWLRNGQPIPGATSATYTATPADTLNRVSVVVTAHRDGYVSVSSVSNEAYIGLAGYSTRYVTISGTPMVGETLTATLTISPTPDQVFWTWKVDGEVRGTGTSYTVQPQDAGKSVYAQAEPRRAGYATQWTWAEVVAVPAWLDLDLVATLSGTPVVGQSLTVEHGYLPGVEDTATYEWYADSTRLEETGPTLLLTADHVGAEITARVTVHRPGHVPWWVVSDPVGPVTAPVVSQDPVTPPSGTQDPTAPAPPVTSLAPSKVTVKAKAGRAQGRHRKVVLTITVKATGQRPTGTVTVRRGGKVVGTGRVGANGVVKIVLKKQPRKTTSYTVQYGGSAAVAASSTKVKVRARR